MESELISQAEHPLWVGTSADEGSLKVIAGLPIGNMWAGCGHGKD